MRWENLGLGKRLERLGGVVIGSLSLPGSVRMSRMAFFPVSDIVSHVFLSSGDSDFHVLWSMRARPLIMRACAYV